MDEFLEFTKKLNDYAKNNQNIHEEITDDDIILAVYYIDNIAIYRDIDVLVFLSAMNLCNAYAKSYKTHDIYRFKKDIGTLIHIINKSEIANTKVCLTNDKGQLYIFQIGDIQFSFHDSKKETINEFYQKDMVWDGIRKQPCAKTLFKTIVASPLSRECKSMFGDNIHEFATKLIADYHSNKITLEEILNSI